VTDPLAQAMLDALGRDPDALDRLRELVGERGTKTFGPTTPAYTVATLAAELGRSERSVRAAIARGELRAVKRGRGWVISADAVAAWAQSPNTERARNLKVRRRPGPGVMARALTTNTRRTT
jgi:excisionase family DNA binding protein